MDKKLHIVSFDVPLPANYGGVIDVFHKVRTLHSAGLKIVLHCFIYGEKQQASDLDNYCEAVYYYRRTTGIQGISLLRPYIVNSRKSNALLKNILADDAPILFEGLHCCYYLNHPSLSERQKYVRTHNVEHDYYAALANAETKWYKRLYYKFEAYMLKNYEVVLKEASALFAIAEKDKEYFSQYGDIVLAPAFHANDMIHSQLGEGDYCLFHGNLAVAENEKAVLELIENVFSKIDKKVIIAGGNPSKSLEEVINEYEHISLEPNPTEEQMQELKREAHVHVLYSNQATGAKLKLMDSLSQGRFVLANANILIDGNLKSTAAQVNTWDEYIAAIEDVFLNVFTAEDIAKREQVLQSAFSNKTNAQEILKTICA